MYVHMDIEDKHTNLFKDFSDIFIHHWLWYPYFTRVTPYVSTLPGFLCDLYGLTYRSSSLSDLFALPFSRNSFSLPDLGESCICTHAWFTAASFKTLCASHFVCMLQPESRFWPITLQQCVLFQHVYGAHVLYSLVHVHILCSCGG